MPIPNTRFANLPAGYDEISGLARMLHKYQIDDGIEAIVSYLSRYYPTDYFEWEQRARGNPNFGNLENIGVVNIARLLDKPSLIPAAMMQCCQLPVKCLMEGFQRADGVHERLSQEDLTNALIARAKLVEVRAQVYAAMCRIAGTGVIGCVGSECYNCLAPIRNPPQSMKIGTEVSSFWADTILQHPSRLPCEICQREIREEEEIILRVFWDSEWLEFWNE